jgi:predicted TIM-barrel fold metal-dependent hydrolase
MVASIHTVQSEAIRTQISKGGYDMLIDANVYWLPGALFDDEATRQHFFRSVPEVFGTRAVSINRDGKQGIAIEKPFGASNLDYFQDDYALETQLRDMDEAAIDVAVLKLPGTQEWLDLELCRQFNDLVTQRQEESRGRMAALGVVPPVGGAESAEEARRCIEDLHLHGLQVSAHYGNHYLDDPMFRPFLKVASDLGATVYVHHTPLPVDYESLTDYTNVRRSLGRCIDQVTAVSREIFSDLFDELPHLRLVHSMLGGGFFAFEPMLFPKDSGNGRFDNDNGKREQHLRRNVFFEMSHSQPWGKGALELAVQQLGADHIVYGSSYPVKKVWLTQGPAFVRDLAISDEDKRLILADNAKKLYGLTEE